jgi:hypothetical protein
MSKRKPVRGVPTMFTPSADSLELLRGDLNTLYEHVATMTNMLRKFGRQIPQLPHPSVDDTAGDLDDD